MGVSKEFSAAKWADNIIAIAEGKTTFGHADHSCDKTELVKMTIDNAFSATSWATEMFVKASMAENVSESNAGVHVVAPAFFVLVDLWKKFEKYHLFFYFML